MGWAVDELAAVDHTRPKSVHARRSGGPADRGTGSRSRSRRWQRRIQIDMLQIISYISELCKKNPNIATIPRRSPDRRRHGAHHATKNRGRPFIAPVAPIATAD